MKHLMSLAVAFFVLAGCTTEGSSNMAENEAAGTHEDTTAVMPALNINADTATFAGGCFWCMQPPFDTVKGVISTTVGYTGGPEQNPTYEQVGSGATGHAESVQIIYDPSVTTYQHLLDIFWHNINPTQVNGQFADHGHQYRTVIFYHNDEQHRLAESTKQQLMQSGKFSDPIATEITAATAFWPAEEYHQKYYKKNYDDYHRYRVGSGREGYLEKTWGSETASKGE